MFGVGRSALMPNEPRPRVCHPPPKPLLIWDGDCHFCRLWVERWRVITGGAVDDATFQEIAERFPELSRNVHDAARDRSLAAVSQLLDDATQKLARTPKGPFSAKRSRATAQIFLDLILLPMLFRSLVGETQKDLKKELPGFVRERVGFFLAACEADW